MMNGHSASPGMRRLAVLIAAALITAAGALAYSPARADSTVLRGVWMPEPGKTAVVPVDGGTPPLSDAGKAAYTRNAATLKSMAATPVAPNDLRRCIPFGPTRLLQQPFPLELVQKDNLLVIIYEHNHVYEPVYLHEAANPDRDPGFMGNSVGTLTPTGADISTISYKPAFFLDDTGLPVSDHLTVTRTLRVITGGKEMQITSLIDDPVMYTHPWTVRQVLKSAPDEHIREYVCGEGTLETRYTN